MMVGGRELAKVEQSGDSLRNASPFTVYWCDVFERAELLSF
jgi:hypothetical protein